MAELTVADVRGEDFAYCFRLYSEAIGSSSIASMRHSENSVEEDRFRSIWKPQQAKLITVDAQPVGWYSTYTGADNVVIEQFYVDDVPLRDRIAEIILNSICDDAKAIGKHTITEALEGSKSTPFFISSGFSQIPRPKIITLQRRS